MLGGADERLLPWGGALYLGAGKVKAWATKSGVLCPGQCPEGNWGQGLSLRLPPLGEAGERRVPNPARAGRGGGRSERTPGPSSADQA